MSRLVLIASFLLSTTLAGCLSHAVHVEPITVAPVQVTMDVTLHVDDSRATAQTDAPAPTAGAESAPTDSRQ